MKPGGVITFLWWLKGEALAALGHAKKAIPLLNTAMENAQALEERFLLWRIHASLGKLYQTMKHQTEAYGAFSAARVIIDELAETVPEGALMESFLMGANNTIDPR